MKKYDCSKTLDYLHEQKRLCETNKICCKCELGEKDGSCRVFKGLSQKDIDILQKWSDEHPEKTRAEALLEKIPTFKVAYNNRPAVCWATAIGEEADLKI